MIRNQEPTREGVKCLLLESVKLVIGAVRADRCPPTGLGHSLKKTLSYGKIGLRPGHVRRGLDKFGGVQIPTVIWFIRHIASKIGHV
jgi:hypothetical protein